MDNENSSQNHQILPLIEQSEPMSSDSNKSKSKLLPAVLAMFFATLCTVGFLGYQNYQLKNSVVVLKEETKSLLSDATQKLTSNSTVTEKENEQTKNNSECGLLELTTQGIVNPYFQFKLFDESLDTLKLDWVTSESDLLKCHIALKVLDAENADIFLTWGNKKIQDFIADYTEYTEVYINEDFTINNSLSGRKIVLKRTIPGSTFLTTYELAYVFQGTERIFVMYTKNNTSKESVLLLDTYLKDISAQLIIL